MRTGSEPSGESSWQAARKLLWHGENSMVCTSSTTGAHRTGCSKRPDVSPAQPRRAKTRRSAGKAAVSRLTLVLLFTFHGCWERSENDAGGLFQHPARASIASSTTNGQCMESGVDKLERSVDNRKKSAGGSCRAEQDSIETVALVDRSDRALFPGQRLQA